MFPCDGYLKLAKKLASIKDEASLRSVVSRAYYASFHKAKMFVQNSGVKFSGGGRWKIHQEILEFLAGHNDANVNLLGTELDRLKNNRNRCDYANSVKNLESVALNAIIGAEEIFNNII